MIKLWHVLVIVILLMALPLVGACTAEEPPATPATPETAPSPETPPTPTPTELPKPEPVPEQKGIEVQNCKLCMYGIYRYYSHDEDLMVTLHALHGYYEAAPDSVQAILTGELMNKTSDNVKLVDLLVKLSNLGRGVPLEGRVGFERIEVLLPIIRPGESSPFIAYGATGYEASEFEVKVEDFTPTTEEPFLGLKISDRKVTKEDVYDFTRYTVTGKVKNTANREARFVQIVCTFYDDSGSVVSVDKRGIGGPNHLMPGDEATFTMIAIYPPKWVSDYRIQVVARKT